MSLRLNLTDTVKAVRSKVNKLIARRINSVLLRRQAKAVRLLKQSIRRWIEQQPEVQSLLSQGEQGSLNAKFGLPPGTPEITIESIIDILENAVDVNIKKVDQNLIGGLDIIIRGSAITSILGISSGSIRSEIGTPLNWLEWLLTRGDQVIIVGYRYIPREDGRSGGGVMRRGKSFRVTPVEYSGVEGDNFITRAFQGRDAEISKILSVALRG